MDLSTDNEDKAPEQQPARPGPLRFCTLQDCMSVMTSWRENPPDSDDDTDNSFTDDEFQLSSIVLPNTNMSNSGKDGKTPSNGDVAVTGSDSDYFSNNTLSATASDNAIRRSSTAITNKSSDEAVDDKNKSKQSSILTRIKRSLKKNPKFVNANSKLIEVTPTTLQFKQNDDGTFEPAEMVIRNTSESSIAYKLKRSDNIFDVTRRMGILKPLETHTVVASVKTTSKITANTAYKLITRVAVIEENQLTEGYQLAKFWKQLPTREVRQLFKVKCVPLAPGEVMADAADFSDADNVSLMTTGSFVSTVSGFTLNSTFSDDLSPSTSAKDKSDLAVKDSKEKIVANDAEITVTRSLDEIKNEIFGERVTHSDEKMDTGLKPKRVSSKVFERRRVEQAKKHIEESKQEVISNSDDKVVEPSKYVPAGDKAKDIQKPEPPVADAGDSTPQKPHDQAATDTVKEKSAPTKVISPVEAKPHSAGGKESKTEGETEEGVDSEKIRKELVAKRISSIESLCSNKDNQEETQKPPQNSSNLYVKPAEPDAEVETNDKNDLPQITATNPTSADTHNEGDVKPKEVINMSDDEKKGFQRVSKTLSEEPHEGSQTMDQKVAAQAPEFVATEFEGPAPEILGLVESQSAKKPNPRRHTPAAKETTKEMKHESEPTLSMQEAYTDVHKLKQAVSHSHSESASVDYPYPGQQQVKSDQRGYALPKPEPYQTDESELECESTTFSNKPSIHIYRSAWSHSPTIPNQKFIKKEVSSRDLTRDHCESGPETGGCYSPHPKVTRNSPFYDFVMSHGQSTTSTNWQSPKSSSASVYCPGHQYKITNPCSPITIEETSNGGMEKSLEFNDIDQGTITVTTHISASNMQDNMSPTPCMDINRKAASKKKSSDYFEFSDDADGEENDPVEWKMRKIQSNRRKIADLAQNVMSGVVFLFVWTLLLVASMINSYGSGLCWEAPSDPEPFGIEWLANFFLDAEVK